MERFIFLLLLIGTFLVIIKILQIYIILLNLKNQA